MLIALLLSVYRMAAIKAVMVVPIFAPRIKGAACLKRTIFFATKGTTREVVTVLERITAVRLKPQKKDINWFWKKKYRKRSGNRTNKRFEISLRNKIIEVKSNTKEMTVRTKLLGIARIIKSNTGLEIFHPVLTLLTVAAM